LGSCQGLRWVQQLRKWFQNAPGRRRDGPSVEKHDALKQRLAWPGVKWGSSRRQSPISRWVALGKCPGGRRWKPRPPRAACRSRLPQSKSRTNLNLPCPQPGNGLLESNGISESPVQRMEEDPLPSRCPGNGWENATTCLFPVRVEEKLHFSEAR
jgi:hypothetical protein